MNINKPQIHSAGSAVSSIQGQPAISILAEKNSGFPDTNPELRGQSEATPSAYQADE